MARHVSSDWLVACWLIYWACLLATFISWIAIFTATNSRQMFVYISTFFDMLLYLVSSMYFVAGSYPHTQDNTHKDYDEEAKHDDLAELMLLETVENPLVSMYNVFSGDAPRSPRNSQKMDDRGTKYSSVKEQMKHDAEVNNLIHKYAKDKSTTTADNGVGNDDDIEMNLKTPVKTNRFGSTYNVIDTEPIYSNNNSTLHNQQSHVPPLCLPGNTQPSSAPAPQHIHSDRSQASMQGSDTSDKSTLSSSKVTARVRVSKFRNIFSNPAKNEQIYSNIRVANISGDQNFIRANHLFFAVPIDVSLLYFINFNIFYFTYCNPYFIS